MRARALLVAAAAALAVLAVPTAARAGGTGGTPPPGATQGPPHAVDVGACVLYANTRGFGADCISGDEGGRTIRQILAGDPFVNCRYTDPAPADIPAAPAPAGQHNVLKICVLNVTEDGVVPGKQPQIQTQVVPWPDGTPVPKLTANQAAAWRVYQAGYPLPIPEFGPAQVPKVNLPTYVWLTPASSKPLAQKAWDGNAYVPMRAYVSKVQVFPGDGQGAVTCAGAGIPYDAAAGIDGQDPGACKIVYQRSSAGQPGGTYRMAITAFWIVQYDEGAGWHTLATYQVNNVFPTRVEEIQTIVD